MTSTPLDAARGKSSGESEQGENAPGEAAQGGTGSVGGPQADTAPANRLEADTPQAETAPAESAQAEDARLLAALRAGDGEAFAALVGQLHRPLIGIASLYVRDRDVAEEVVQEAWLAVVKGLDRFEGRSSLRTWISRIVTYQARTRGERERRSMPLSELLDDQADTAEPAVDGDRFRQSPPWQGHWSDAPAAWEGDAERRLLAGETLEVIAGAIEALPPAQRTVITLRDVDGWTSDEVCDALEVSPGNQRVLLHRARSKVRSVLERFFADDAA